jgi:single-stranded DNA-binding protein
VIARDRLAQFAARYITTGRLVHVIGWLTYRTVEARDGSHVVAEIRASEILLLDRPTRSQSRDVPKP